MRPLDYHIEPHLQGILSASRNHLKTETLEVFRFGNIEEDGVIRTLPVGVRLAQRAMTIHRGIANRLLEER